VQDDKTNAKNRKKLKGPKKTKPLKLTKQANRRKVKSEEAEDKAEGAESERLKNLARITPEQASAAALARKFPHSQKSTRKRGRQCRELARALLRLLVPRDAGKFFKRSLSAAFRFVFSLFALLPSSIRLLVSSELRFFRPFSFFRFFAFVLIVLHLNAGTVFAFSSCLLSSCVDLRHRCVSAMPARLHHRHKRRRIHSYYLLASSATYSLEKFRFRVARASAREARARCAWYHQLLQLVNHGCFRRHPHRTELR